MDEDTVALTSADLDGIEEALREAALALYNDRAGAHLDIAAGHVRLARQLMSDDFEAQEHARVIAAWQDARERRVAP